MVCQKVKLKNIIERLCDNLQSLSELKVKKIKENYFSEIKNIFLKNQFQYLMIVI